MRTTTTVLAVGATALALPVTAHAAQTSQTDLRAPLAGTLSAAAQMHEAHEQNIQRRLSARATRLAREVAHERDHGFSPRHYRAAVRAESTARLAHRVKRLRHDIEHARAAAARRRRREDDAVASPTLQAIARCESGGNPAADTGNGFYGMYQFTQATWESVGGTGNPAAASAAEQTRRAAALYAREGASPWPVCGR